MEKQVLPPLPYPKDALEPHYDAATVELHHDKHHAGYVSGFNAALDALARARAEGNHSQVKHLSRELAFHGGGHILHSTFWSNLRPDGGGRPAGALSQAVNESFGSFEAFDAHLRAATGAVEGSGWGVLATDRGGNLVVHQIEKHQNQVVPGWTAILVIDVWEHAYYLKYQNRRAEFVNAILDHLVNWDDVARRFAAATT